MSSSSRSREESLFLSARKRKRCRLFSRRRTRSRSTAPPSPAPGHGCIRRGPAAGRRNSPGSSTGTALPRARPRAPAGEKYRRATATPRTKKARNPAASKAQRGARASGERRGGAGATAAAIRCHDFEIRGRQRPGRPRSRPPIFYFRQRERRRGRRAGAAPIPLFSASASRPSWYQKSTRRFFCISFSFSQTRGQLAFSTGPGPGTTAS